jgi:2-hydroxychromene-2-carboxylate isomerase
MQTIVVYSDYKSPYAYLAKDLIYALARDCAVKIDWLPYVLDIPSYLGSAELDASGKLVAAERNAHQWRRVRYSYMDCRREANKRGLVILGTRKIWDSSLAAIGMLWAKRQGESVLTAYHDRVFERFWRRDLDIEDKAAIAAVLQDAGADVGGFDDYAAGAGRQEREAVQAAAEEAGVFGVPSLLVDGELFWGREHLPAIRERLQGAGS